MKKIIINMTIRTTETIPRDIHKTLMNNLHFYFKKHTNHFIFIEIINHNDDKRRKWKRKASIIFTIQFKKLLERYDLNYFVDQYWEDIIRKIKKQ